MAYGSLRNGEYNFDRFQSIYGEDNFKYVRTTTIKGFEIYDLGSYPGLRISDNPDSTVVVDILEVNPDAYHSIYRMEIGARYTLASVKDEETGDMYEIYLYNYEEGDLVENGDWSEYLKLV